jgi:hypothetical protein
MKLFVVCLFALAASACRSNPDGPVAYMPGVPSPARWANLSKDCPDDAPAYSLPASLGGPINITATQGNGRDAYIARTNPGGWGGRAFRDSVQYYMYMVDTTQTQVLFATLQQRGILVPDNTKLLKGRWDFAQLYEWQWFFYPKMEDKVEFSTYIDVPLNRLEFSTTSEADRMKLDSVFSALDIPCFLAAIAVDPPGPPRGV